MLSPFYRFRWSLSGEPEDYNQESAHFIAYETRLALMRQTYEELQRTVTNIQLTPYTRDVTEKKHFAADRVHLPDTGLTYWRYLSIQIKFLPTLSIPPGRQMSSCHYLASDLSTHDLFLGTGQPTDCWQTTFSLKSECNGRWIISFEYLVIWFFRGFLTRYIVSGSE